MAWRVGVNDTQQLAAALAFEQMDGAVPFGRTHRGVAGGRCDVEHQVSDVGIAARRDSKLRSSCDGSTDRRTTTSSPTPQTQAIMLRSRVSPTRPAPRSTLRLLRHHRRVCRDDPRSVRCDADPPRGAASCGRRRCRRLLGQDRSARWAQRQPVITSADVDQGFFSRSESRRRARRAVTRNCVSRTTPTIATTAAPATAAMNNAVPSGRDPVKPR